MEKNLKWIKNKKKQLSFKIGKNRDFDESETYKVLQFHKSFSQYKQTPLCSMNNLADYLGLAKIYVKDESHRFGLNAFKVLGASYAIGRCMAKRLGRDIEDTSFSMLQTDEVKKQLGSITFASATDGNHGRGVAWTAKQLGLDSVIYMPKGSTLKRLNNIKAIGAKAMITDVNYDDTVRIIAKEAAEKDWQVIQDTAWEGYEEVPKWIMQGYSTVAKEVIEQLNEERPTHIFLQAGVGAFAAVMTAVVVETFHENPPMIVIVEPDKADCFYRSVKAEKITKVDGDMNSIMAGLACGEPNPIAWEILSNYGDVFMSVPDWVTAKGMRVLGNPLKGDPRIISGESGAVTTGVLSVISEDTSYAELKELLDLDENSKVLLFSTEGDTDPEVYRSIVWDGVFQSIK